MITNTEIHNRLVERNNLKQLSFLPLQDNYHITVTVYSIKPHLNINKDNQKLYKLKLPITNIYITGYIYIKMYIVKCDSYSFLICIKGIFLSRIFKRITVYYSRK